MSKLTAIIKVTALAGLLAAAWPTEAGACSRVLYVGDTAATSAGSDSVLRIVGRSLDWQTPIPTNLYVYPAGIDKVGDDKPGAIRWTSRYGAVYAVGYDGGITEGMNEKGLAINGLFFRGTVYNNVSNEGLPSMSLAMLVGWLLDLNATTDEVVARLRSRNFSISGATFDSGTAATLHWAITDAAGRCAVVEFVDGDIHIYQGQDIEVLTNLPQYPDMLAINGYWNGVGGTHMLPGGVSSPDRFVRGCFFANNVVHTNDLRQGFAIIRSIMANVSVPLHYTVVGMPETSSTQWRSYSNLRDLLYGFEPVGNLGVMYVDLRTLDLRPGAPVLRLDTSHTYDVVGNANHLLRQHAPFTPMF